MNRRDLIKLLGVSPLLKLTVTSAAQVLPDEPADLYQLVVYGATPGGVACAVRAAREGVKVLVVNPTGHLGGMFSSGLGIMDTLYNGSRAPIYDEFRQSIYEYYRLTYGKDSPQYESAGPGISKTKYEARVAEQLINDLLARERNIVIVKGLYPASAKKENGRITEVVFREMNGTVEKTVKAKIFADCSYEADLAVIAGVPYRMGRESKQEFGEQFAGVIYSKDIDAGETGSVTDTEAAVTRKLNLFRYKESGTKIFLPESTGEAHPAIQAFNLRSIITDDPGNMVMPERPANYDPDHFKKHYTHKAEKLTLSRPNRKSSLNYPKLIGLQNKYVEGDWEERKKIIGRYKDEVSGLLYFRQNDDSLPAAIREHWKKYGFARDEFADNGYLPYEVYVRESRRIKGKAIFTEHDARLQKGLKRAPVHGDSIGITEWFLDSHACTERTVGDSKEEGEVMLKSETVPGQIPMGTILPIGLENLLVPVCLSASHIGWGAIRLEPVWMGLGEVAGYIATEAINRGTGTGSIKPDALCRKLASNRFMLTFFNDVEGREAANWYPAVQYLGTKGFFASYEARPDHKLTKALADRWIDQVKIRKEKGEWKAGEHALRNSNVEEQAGDELTAGTFARSLDQVLGTARQASALLKSLGINDNTSISRGDAARLIFQAIAGGDKQ